jgi:hypothetical protein
VDDLSAEVSLLLLDHFLSPDASNLLELHGPPPQGVAGPVNTKEGEGFFLW